MDVRIKRLMGFITEDNLNILVSPCEFLKDIEEIKKYGDVRCTHDKCENYENCIKINMKALFLPLESFNTWIVDTDRFKINIGYIFYLASQTLKNFGILAIKGKGDDEVALSYGFQILYHGEWHYYLKSTSREKFIAREEWVK